MKILILIPVWRRPEILRLTIKNICNVKPDYADVSPLFILSPEDPDIEINEKLTRGFDRVYAENEFLSDKMNAGILYAMGFEWDFLMTLGSDNIYTYILWEIYQNYFENESYFAIDDFYVWDTAHDRAFYIEGYVAEPALGGIGAGRVIKRDILDADPCIWQPGSNRGMDGISAWYLYKLGYIQRIVPTQGRPVMLDIKTLTNLNQGFELWEDRTKAVEVDWIKENFGLLVDWKEKDLDLINFDNFHERVCKLSQVMNKRDAFNMVNARYEYVYGEKRYANLGSYKVMVNRRYGK